MTGKGKNAKKNKKPYGKYKKKYKKPIPRFGNSGLYPSTQLVRMPYVDFNKQNAGVFPNVNQQFYSIMNINDPVVAVGGHQPMGHDEAMALYNHFCVVGAKITVKFSPTASGAWPVICGVYVSDDTTVTTTNLSQLMEQGKSKYRQLNISDASNQAVVTMNYSTKKWYNVTNVKDNLNRFGGLFSSSSTFSNDDCYFCVYIGSPEYGGTFDPPEILTTVRIEYVVLLSEPKELTQS